MKCATLCFLALAAATSPRTAAAQVDTTLFKRWVGSYQGRVLNFEFYGDTMLVVNDQYGLNIRVTPDSIIATGDTTVMGSYHLVLNRLIFETPEGSVLTMASQPPLARPLTGRWIGELGTDDRPAVELQVFSTGNARWRRATDTRWVNGEWERATRVVTFTWVDNSEWTGQYDPVGNALLFDHTLEDTGGSVFRRAFR